MEFNVLAKSIAQKKKQIEKLCSTEISREKSRSVITKENLKLESSLFGIRHISPLEKGSPNKFSTRFAN